MFKWHVSRLTPAPGRRTRERGQPDRGSRWHGENSEGLEAVRGIGVLKLLRPSYSFCVSNSRSEGAQQCLYLPLFGSVAGLDELAGASIQAL